MQVAEACGGDYHQRLKGAIKMRYFWTYNLLLSVLTIVVCCLDFSVALTAQQLTVLRNLSSQFPSSLWNTSDSYPCQWHGVDCQGNNVVGLHLSGFHINGSVFQTACQLPALRTLDLSSNSLTTLLPSDISNCGSLVSLNLSFNSFSGVLPSLTSLPKLKYLDLSYNRFYGPFGSQIESLKDLRILNLTSNQFNGPIPLLLGGLEFLEQLQLSRNEFIGIVPRELASCAKLTYLDLSQNNLTGSIPVKIGSLVNLETLILSANNLWGGIPKSLGNLTNLTRLAANQNRLAGSIPVDLASIATLEFLDLSYNKLNGTIPPKVFSLSSLRSIDLTSNLLVGPIPQNFSTKLFRLLLGGNSLNGSIPTTIGNAQRLAFLEADGNKLEGYIPQQLTECKNISLLNLAQNRLTGPLFSQLASLRQLQVFNLSGNSFSGTIPEAFANFSGLFSMDVSSNSLSGTIPTKLFELQGLQYLRLQNNHLTGTIPRNIQDCKALLELQLGGNDLYGTIPIEIGQASSLQIALNLSYNLLQGSIPSTLSQLNKLEILDLSNNNLTGKIPDALASMDSLTELVLSNNHLTGTVPEFRKSLQFNITGNNVTENKGQCAGQCVSAVDGKKKPSAGLLIGVAVAGAVFALAVVALSMFACKYFQREHEIPEAQASRNIEGHFIYPYDIHRVSIDFEKAVEATLDPANIVLKSKFSTYYKAVMPSGTSYSVKKLDWTGKVFKSGRYQKLGAELEKQGRLSHPNIMTPLAYVLKPDCALLFYEYVHKGTLSEFLHNSNIPPLDWPSRCSIAVGIAQGLEFLHGYQHPIFHLDLTSKSIFLKSPTEPQIGDIELCKIVDPSTSSGSPSTIAGSVGYIPPEYAYTMRVTMAGNVYSFGVVLLELLTARPPISNGMEIAKWVQSALSQDEIWEHILDARIRNSSVQTRNEMLSMLKIARSCINSSPDARPKIRTLVGMLQMIRQTS